MENTCLLLVDIQSAMIEDHPYNQKAFTANIKKLLELCRGKGIEVIYVRHDGGDGDPLKSGEEGWQIYPPIGPHAGEKIIDKQFNSAFRKTELKECLDGKGIRTIILVGMQTEYCIDATCKVAFEYEYNVIIPSGATTTFDMPGLSATQLCDFYEHDIWDGRYAKVLKMNELEALIIR